MFVHSSRRLGLQRGASLLGMATMAVVVGAIMLLGVRIFPAINEYLTVRKTTLAGGQPVSRAEVLSGSARVQEIARMLGGAEITPLTQRHAREMLARP